MPHKLNLIDAVKYKENNSECDVWFEQYTDTGTGNYLGYFEEELISNNGEYGFKLRDGFTYPSWYDKDNSLGSNFYNRHIFGVIFAETQDEYDERNEKVKTYLDITNELKRKIERTSKK